MATSKDIEIEIAKLRQQLDDLASSMRYGGGDRDLMERLDKLIEVLSAAAVEEEEKGTNKLDKLIEALTEEREDETDVAMQEVARSLAGVAEMMKENTELLRETVKKLETLQTGLKKEKITLKRPLEKIKEPPEEIPEEVIEGPLPDIDLTSGVRGMDLLEEKIKKEVIPKETSLEDILTEAEELGIDTGFIKEKRKVGGSMLPYILGIAWFFLGILKFLSPLEISFLTKIDDFLMEGTVGMLFSIFLIVTGIPMILIGMQGVPKKKTKLFNILSYVVGILWIFTGVIFLMILMQGKVLEGIMTLPIAGIMLASGMLSIFMGISMSQKKFNV
ncbi:MAG: hypothetical protein KAT49_03890 [Methanomicrobia archaeon]|nr:hypothetical protein [Methanomicrobia archaeon]